MTADFTVSAIGLRPLDTTLKTDIATSGASATTGGVGFADAVAQAGDSLIGKLEAAESASIRGMKGEATAYEVASSVMEAEQTLRTAIAIRDKFVSAYLEISRMQI